MGTRSVSISDEVYAAIARRGRFGETVDDVLRRVLKVPDREVPASGPIPSTARRVRSARLASRRVSPRVQDGLLHVSIEGAGDRKWTLPGRDNRNEIRRVTHEALDWATELGATEGQLKAIRKELSNNRYFITSPRS